MFLLSGVGLGAAITADSVFPHDTQFRVVLEAKSRDVTSPGTVRSASIPGLAELLAHTTIRLRAVPPSGVVRGYLLMEVTDKWKWRVPTSYRNVANTVRQLYQAGGYDPANIRVQALYDAAPLGPESAAPAPGGGAQPTYPTATACLNRGGTCMDVNECQRLGRTSIVNLCPGTPNNIRCCLPATGGSPTPRADGGGGGGGGGGSAAPPIVEAGMGSGTWGTGHYVLAGVALGALVVGGIKVFGKKGKRGRRRR